jgi:hypothetical protein
MHCKMVTSYVSREATSSDVKRMKKLDGTLDTVLRWNTRRYAKRKEAEDRARRILCVRGVAASVARSSNR